MKTITGKIICAGRLKDNNGDEFHGVMIDTGINALMNNEIAFYKHCGVLTCTSTAESILQWLQIGICNKEYKRLATMLQEDIEQNKNK